MSYQKPDGGLSRRTDIVKAARQLFQEKGYPRTTVLDITRRLGVTRTLFYHYFSDKEAVTAAVLDDYIEDFIDSMRIWNAQRQVGNIEHALDSVLQVLRVGLFEHDAFRRSLVSHENAQLYIEFINRVADRVSTYIVNTTVEDYGKLHEIRIDHIYETFYVLIIGIVGYIRRHPDADDGVLKDIISQTLHMDRGVCLASEDLN
jgi:AcrR family transcriptional regulator